MSLLILALPALAALFAIGCSGANAPRRELSTREQTASFVAYLARRGNADGWVLVAGASPEAARAWVERTAIADLGTRIRKEGGEWGCELAATTYRLGGLGAYSVGDREGLGKAALEAGATRAQIRAFNADFLKMEMVDLRQATATICPGAYFGH